jgi:FkbM family methyltransferase
MIPKIIHQTWKTDQVPSEWKAFADSWKFHHPDWQYRLWTDADGAAFVEEFYPEFQETYLSYPYGIQRADAIRYLLIYHYGGLYADLDFECLQSFESLRDNNQLIIGLEPHKHAREQSRPELLCNALFASQPGSVFLKTVIDFLTAGNSQTPAHDVLNTTGPMMLQNVYEQTAKQGVEAHPPIRFCPFVNNAPELAQLAENSVLSERIRQKLISLGCFAVHHWANSWTQGSPKQLLNPKPSEIEGFEFHPMLDSPEMNLFNGGRDIAVLANFCRNTPEVVAFNTDGFAKHTICASADFKQLQNVNPDEGLYVKKSMTSPNDCLKPHFDKQCVYLPNIGPKPFILFLDEINDPVISAVILANLVWEPVETALLCKLLSAGETVIDIGAHIGYFTVLFSCLVGEQGSVISFEPEADNYSLLQANVSINGLDNVIIENQALSNRSGVAPLYLSSDHKGDHRLAPTAARDVQKVTLIALDQYLAKGLQQIHFIKSDTQGHELEVLQGMTQVIERNKDHLCCLLEFSPGLLAAANPEGISNFIDFFDSYQTEIYWISEKIGTHELVLMDKAALHDVARSMLKHESLDHSCNILVFFSSKARIKYFSKLGW